MIAVTGTGDVPVVTNVIRRVDPAERVAEVAGLADMEWPEVGVCGHIVVLGTAWFHARLIQKRLAVL